MKKGLFMMIILSIPVYLTVLFILQIYKKKTTTYFPLKNEFAHWTNKEATK